MTLVPYFRLHLPPLIVMGLAFAAIVTAPPRAAADEPLLRFETGAHTTKTVGAAVDAAGRVLVTASEDKTARIWSLPDLRLLGVLRPQIGPDQEGLLFAVAVSPDGRLAAVAGSLGRRGADKLVLLFDLRTREVVRSWAGPAYGTYSLAFSADGTKLAAGFGGAQGIGVWSVADGSEILRDKDYGEVVYGLSFAEDGRLATSSLDRFVRLYDATGKLFRKVQLERGAKPMQVAFSPNGEKLAIGLLPLGGALVLDGHTLEITANPVGYDNYEMDGSAKLSQSRAKRLPLSRTTTLDVVAWSRDGKQLFAAGNVGIGPNASAHTNQTALIWPTGGLNAGLIGPSEFISTRVETELVHIIPLADKAIALTSIYGDIEVIGPDGVRRASAGPVAADFRARPPPLEPITHSDMMVSNDGHRVAWSQWNSNGRWDLVDTREFGLSNSTKMSAGLAQSFIGSATKPDSSSFILQPWEWDHRRPELYYRHSATPSRILAVDADEHATSAAIQDDHVLLGTGSMLRFFDSSAKLIWGHHIPGAALRVIQAAGGKIAVAALGDGTVRWYRLEDGQELLALFLTRDGQRWVAFTPSGYYDASPGGENLIGWQVNRGPDQAADFFPVSRFRDRMRRPDVVRLVLDTLDEDAALRQANVASGRNESKVTKADIVGLGPPVLELVSAPERFATDRVTITFRVRSPPTAPMLGDPKIKVNGEWQPKSRSAFQSTADGLREVVIGPLPPHNSAVEIYGDNVNSRSEPIAFGLKWDGRAASSPGQQGQAAEHKPRLFLLAVGVSQYKKPELRLNFAAHDAEQFVAAMESQRGKLYSDVVIKLLRDDQATLAEVKSALAWFKASAASDDVGVLFLAGHGMKTPDGNYFYAPADFDPARVLDTGVGYLAIRSALDDFATSGNKALLFVDTCYSGGVLGSHLSASGGGEFASTLTQPDRGIMVLSASKGDQLSWEDPKWGDGAFTTALLEGIVEAKADPAQSGEISVLDLGSYVHRRVLVLTSKRQEPLLSIPEGGVADFTVAKH